LVANLRDDLLRFPFYLPDQLRVVEGERERSVNVCDGDVVVVARNRLGRATILILPVDVEDTNPRSPRRGSPPSTSSSEMISHIQSHSIPSDINIRSIERASRVTARKDLRATGVALDGDADQPTRTTGRADVLDLVELASQGGHSKKARIPASSSAQT